MTSNSILDYVDKWTRETPDNLRYAFLNVAGEVTESYTFRQFHERTNYLAHYLSSEGIVSFNEPVILNYQPGIEVSIVFFACIKLGALPVPIQTVASVSSLKKLCYIVKDSGAKALLSDQGGLKRLSTLLNPHGDTEQSPHDGHQKETVESLKWLPTDTIQGKLSDFATRPNNFLFLQYTSGSTRDPRGVLVSHKNVIDNCQATLDHKPTGVFWLPHYHDMGLIGYYLFMGMMGGSAYGFSAFNFLRKPTLWFETISKYSATITSAPNFAFEYCLREDKVPKERLNNLDLSSLRCMMNASEPVRIGTLTNFLAKFSPYGLQPEALQVYYGLAENTLSVTAKGRTQVTVNRKLIEKNHLRIESASDYNRLNQLQIVSCGYPVSGTQVKIVDRVRHRELGEDRIGEIWVTGESKTQGYWKRPALTAHTFQAQIQDDASQTKYLRTGDLGFLHDDELFVCSRLKEMMIIGGANYFPADIEAVVEESSDQVRQGCIAAFSVPDPNGSERVVIMAEANKRNAKPNLQKICQAVSQQCHVEVKELMIVAHGILIKTSSGKISRQKCKELWQMGQLKPVDRLVQDDKVKIENPIQSLLSRFDLKSCKDCTLAELGLDSLTLVSLSLGIEQLLPQEGRMDRDVFFEQFLDLRLLQAITLSELVTLEKKLSSNNPLTELSSPILAQKLKSISDRESRLIAQDVELTSDLDFSLDSSKTNALNGQRKDGQRKVFLTGATGFLGAFILESLLRLTQFEIVVIVRADNVDHARLRLEAALKRTDLWDEALRAVVKSRVRALPGDISQPRFGLTEAIWTRLSHELSQIYHCGAEVDYVKSYQALRPSNTLATAEILRLASENSLKELHYISTTFIFGFSKLLTLWEKDSNKAMTGLNFGYSQSKWVSEQLVHKAAKRGLPVRIYRPSLVTASKTGRFVRRDIMARILGYMIQYGISIDSANQISFLPVDVCANNIVAISLESAGKTTDETTQTTALHLTANNYYNMQTVCSLITQNYGYSFDYVSLGKFIEHINCHCKTSDSLFPLLPFLNKNHRRISEMSEKRYDNTSYQAAQIQTPLMMQEPPLAEIVHNMVSFLKADNLIDKSANVPQA